MDENIDETLKAVKEEYEKKLLEQAEALNAEKEKALKEQEEKHIAQLRALISGQKSVEEVALESTPAEEVKEEKVEEKLFAQMREKYNLK